jgi:hypothetical protein
VIPPDGPIKILTLRGIKKDSPPYRHNGRLRALAGSAGLFKLSLESRLAPAAGDSLVAYLHTL